MPGWLSWVARARGAGAAPTDPIEDALARLGVRHFDDDILGMKIAELRKHFGYSTSTGIRKQPFFRNVVWQIHEQIQAGRLPMFYIKHGFIRGMWYHIKARIDRYKPLRGRYYGSMIKALTDLVRAGVVSYRDFNFRDRDEALHKLGTDNPYILLYAEKDGLISVMEELHELYGATILTLGGTPSLMSTNYLVSEMVAAGLDLTHEFVCFSLVDFDPDGWDTAGDFLDHLKTFGLANRHRFQQYGQETERLDLIDPKNLTADDPPSVRYTLPAKVQRSRMCAAWAALTGGVDGRGSRKYGLESDEFSQERIFELVGQAVAPFLSIPPELVQRRARMRSLEKATTDFMVYKMLHPKRPPPRPRSRPARLPPIDAAREPDPPTSRQLQPASRSTRRRATTRPPRQATRRPRA